VVAEAAGANPKGVALSAAGRIIGLTPIIPGIGIIPIWEATNGA